MAMDRSHDNRSAGDARPRQDEIDPWSEFLSESSEELQHLQGSHPAGDTTTAESQRQSYLVSEILKEANHVQSRRMSRVS
jgi:hypothetical protein